ncbi:hypothetical protein GCM10029978_053970 [Actinoallomurus acanthiterrae]
MCQEPRRHPAVRKYCVKPITRHGPAEIREQVKDYLRQEFPLGWPGPSVPDEDTHRALWPNGNAGQDRRIWARQRPP